MRRLGRNRRNVSSIEAYASCGCGSSCIDVACSCKCRIVTNTAQDVFELDMDPVKEDREFKANMANNYRK